MATRTSRTASSTAAEGASTEEASAGTATQTSSETASTPAATEETTPKKPATRRRKSTAAATEAEAAAPKARRTTRSRSKKAESAPEVTEATEATDAPSTEEVEEAPAKPARARRSRKAAAAAATETAQSAETTENATENAAEKPGEDSVNAQSAVAAGAEASDAEEKKPARRRAARRAAAAPAATSTRSRRKTATSVEEAPAAEDAPVEAPSEAAPSEVVAAALPETATNAEAAAEVAAAARPVRRRRRVTAAAGAPAAAPEAEAQPVLPVAATEEETAEAEAEALVSSADDAEDAVLEAGTLEAVDGEDAADEAEEDAASEADDEVQEEPEVAFLPAASLLFQAPDPARARRRRRATAVQAAPRGAGEPLSFVEEMAEAAAQLEGEAAPAASERATGKAAAALAEAGAGSRPARRGRRRVTAAAGAPQHVEETPVIPGSAQDEAVRGESEGADEAAGSEGTSRRGRKRKTRASRAQDLNINELLAEEAAAQEGEAEGSEDSDDADSDEAGEATEGASTRRKRRRGGRGRRSRNREAEAAESSESDATEGGDEPDSGEAQDSGEAAPSEIETGEEGSSSRRRRRRRSRTRSDAGRDLRDEVTALKGSTRLEAKRQRRREGRAAGRRRPIVTEAEFLARRESVDRQMIVREQDGLNQIAVLEDGVLVEHYVARHTQSSMVGNVYVGRVQNVLPSMEAAFVDLGKGRNAVLYAGEVNWDMAGMEGKPRKIEDALSSGDTVLVQVTKDPIGHKGARLTSQITLAGRYLVLVPGGTMTGISRKLPDTERHRLKSILKRVVPDDAGVIVRTAAEGASEEQLRADVERLRAQWASIEKKSKQVLAGSGKAPVLLKGEPELAVRVVRDVFNEDFRKLIVQGPDAWQTISEYVTELSPDLADRLEHWVAPEDVFTAHRIDEQLAKGFDRKVWLPSGGTLIIDRTEAMTVIDVNTGRFTGAGGTLEETVTRNNLEAAEEIVRQLRLRDIGGMVVIDFVDMVLESNRDLVLRRLVECLGRDRTRHQVTEVTSLGLVQMTRKRVGQGLVEAFSTPCDCCGGRGFIVHSDPVENQEADMSASASRSAGRQSRTSRGSRRSKKEETAVAAPSGVRHGRVDADDVSDDATRAAVRGALAQIAAAAEHAHAQEVAGSGDGAGSETAVPEFAGEASGASVAESGAQPEAVVTAESEAASEAQA